MIYLASLSKRRCELLDQIKVNYQQIAISVDETPYPQESVPDYVRRLALTKARTGRLAVSTACPVLGADTVIVYDKQLLGKPVDEDDARRMLRILSGNKHQVMTAVAVVTPTREKIRLSISRVHFRRLSEADIQAYIKTGEPLDKAGSYAIQGLASIFIKHLEGSYSGVMGLPLYETANLLTEMGIKVVETD